MASSLSWILGTDNRKAVVQAGESSDIVLTLTDLQNPAVVIPKTSLITLTVTLYELASESVINLRNNQNILDTNNGSVTSGGVVTLKLGPSDNPIVGTVASGERETHIAQFAWTFIDSGGATRTGKGERLAFYVQKLPTPI